MACDNSPKHLGYAQFRTQENPMTQRLHLVFGGELTNPTSTEFKDISQVHIVGMFPDYASAYRAWKAEAQRTVDDAHTRYFISHLHRLLDERSESSPTQEIG
jgi:hypothetical protein